MQESRALFFKVNAVGQWGKIIITVMEFAHTLGLIKCLCIIQITFFRWIKQAFIFVWYGLPQHWPDLKNLKMPKLDVHHFSKVWQYGLRSFQTGDTKLERFLPTNQHTQRILQNFENWINGEVSKSAKSPNLLTFKVNFLYQKLSESFSIFFSLKNINLGAHFLLLTFFDIINFYITLLSKMMPNF